MPDAKLPVKTVKEVWFCWFVVVVSICCYSPLTKDLSQDRISRKEPGLQPVGLCQEVLVCPVSLCHEGDVHT